MKKKIICFIICMLMVTSSTVFLNKNTNIKADDAEENEYYLDFEYMWNVTTELANVIHNESIYGPGDIKKGRSFGSVGDLWVSDFIFEEFQENCSFSNARQVQLGNIDGPGERVWDYSEFVKVTSYDLWINHTNYPYNNNPLPEDYFPEVAVRPECCGGITMNRIYDDIRVINEDDYNEDYPKWRMGIEPLNISYVELNNYNSLMGNLTYIAPEDPIPDEYAYFETVFMFDKAVGIEAKIENATNASGIIIIDDSTIGGYEFTTASSYNVPIVEIAEDGNDSQNLTDVKQYLGNGTSIVVDNSIFNDKITFIHNMSSPLCGPDFQHVIVYNLTNQTVGITDIAWNISMVKINNIKHLIPDTRCLGFIMYASITNNCHITYAQNIKSLRVGLRYPLFALPGYSVNKTVGEFLWEKSHDDPENTYISGHINQIHYKEGTDEDSYGVEAYNVEAELNIPDSPNDAIVVISSRMDAMWNECPSDSGAGNGIIMGIAEYMQRLNQSGIQPKYNITFLMTTNEENGMYGAQFFSDSHPHPDYNIKYWIGTDQLGFKGDEVHLENVYKKSIHREIGRTIAELIDYEGKTGYGMFHNTTYEPGAKYYYLYLKPGLGAGAEDVVFWERPETDTILIHKGGDWLYHHSRGNGLTEGDVLDPAFFDKNDVSVFYNLTWDIVKYFSYDPDCWFESISHTLSDSPNDFNTYNDSVNVTYTINTSMLHDKIRVRAILFAKAQQGHPAFPLRYRYVQEKEYAITPEGIEDYIEFSLPKNAPEGNYNLYVYLYNSTGKINNIIFGPEDESLDSGFFADDRYLEIDLNMHPPNDPPEKPDTPDGDSEVSVWETDIYSTSTWDRNEDRFRYQWKWKQSSNPFWWTVFTKANNETHYRLHTWWPPIADDTEVRVRATDIHNSPNVMSEWSDPLPVTMSQGCFFSAPTSTLVYQSTKFTAMSSGLSEPLTYSWDFTESRAYQEGEPIHNHTYNTTNDYVVRLRVIDDNGVEVFYNRSIRVAYIIANFTNTPISVQPNETMYFNDTSTTYNGSHIVNWTWNFDDGNVSYTQNTSHAYMMDGEYNVTLTVTDNQSHNDMFYKIIYVDSVPPDILYSTYSPYFIVCGSDVTIYADFFDNQSGIKTAKVNITSPDNSSGNFTMYNSENSAYDYEYVFNDTWQAGQYNITIWVQDYANNSNSTTGYWFIVSPMSPDNDAVNITTHPTLSVHIDEPNHESANVSFYEWTPSSFVIDSESEWNEGSFTNTTTDGNGSLQLIDDTSIFGDGLDGDVTIPPGTTTLEGDMNYHNLTIPSLGTLNTDGYTVYVSGTLLNYGWIIDSSSGVSGGDGGEAGDGQDPWENSGGPPIPDDGECGTSGTGRGGDGGAGGAGGGGAKAKLIAPPYTEVDADGGDGGAGGAGGTGGGEVILYAYKLNNQGVIHADGGDGQAGSAGQSGEYYSWGVVIQKDLAGGGGGGGDGGDGGDGGFVNITYSVLIDLNEEDIHASGGNGGSYGSRGGRHYLVKAGYALWDWWNYSGGNGCSEGLDGDGGAGEYEQYLYSGYGYDGADGSDGDQGQVTLTCHRYVPSGSYSKIIDAGIVVGWSNLTLNQTTPDETGITVSYGENTSDSWKYYNDLSNVPDCRWLKVILYLSTTNYSATPIVDKVNISSCRYLLNTVTNVSDGSYAEYNWTGLDLNTSYYWQVRMFNEISSSYGPVWCFNTIENRIFEISSVISSPDTVGFGFNVSIGANVTYNDGDVSEVKVNITYPDDSSSNFTMSHTGGETYEYVFDDTWLVGQYNFTIWAFGDFGNSTSSSGHSFNISANATINIATLQDTYSSGEYINITDPPSSPEPQDWIIENNTVFLDTDDAYLSATPHTMKRSGWATFELLSKQHSGSIDIGFGLDRDAMSFGTVQLWKNYVHDKYSYTFSEETRYVTFNDCTDFEPLNISLYDEDDFDLGNDNNTLLCRLTLIYEGETKELLIAFMSKTILDEENGVVEFSYKDDFWIEIVTEEAYWDWKTIENDFDVVEYIFGDMDIWYFHRDIDIVEDYLYTFRIWVDVEENSQGKYWWVMKPHNKDIQQAIVDGQFYFLDPWWDVKHITTLLPDGDGNSSDWSTEPAPYDNYQCVDDDPDNPNNRDYVYTNTMEYFDRYTMDDLLNGTNPPANTSVEIQEVALFVYGRQGNVYIKPDWGVDYDSVQSLGNAWDWHSKNFSTVLNGSAITVSDIDDMIYELKKHGSQGPDCQVSAVYAEVAWNYIRPFEINYTDESPVDTSIGNTVDGDGITTSIDVSYWASSDVVLYESFTDAVSDEGSVYSSIVRGQTFTVDETFDVVNISLKLKKIGSPSGDLRLDVFEVDGSEEPTGESLSSAVINASELSSAFDWVDFYVDPYELEYNTMYAFVLNFSDGDSSNYINWSCDFDDGGYSDGEMLYSTDGGSSWSDPGEEADGLFKIYGITGEYYDLSFLSNSSGSWVEYGNVRVFCNGSYSAFNSNFSDVPSTYWWMCNASNSRGWDESSIFKFSTRNQSKIKNTGSTNITGYLLMQMQFWNETQGDWVVDNDTVNETTTRTINSSEQLALDLIFNGLVGTDDLVNGDGTYRVYAAFRDPDGDVLICDDESLLEAWYEFEVDTS